MGFEWIQTKVEYHVVVSYKMCEPPVRFINDVVRELMDKIAESYAQNKQSKNFFHHLITSTTLMTVTFDLQLKMIFWLASTWCFLII